MDDLDERIEAALQRMNDRDAFSLMANYLWKRLHRDRQDKDRDCELMSNRIAFLEKKLAETTKRLDKAAKHFQSMKKELENGKDSPEEPTGAKP